jgi:hypothetical protein
MRAALIVKETIQQYNMTKALRVLYPVLVALVATIYTISEDT